jgi:CheY-like chemotaxis protein
MTMLSSNSAATASIEPAGATSNKRAVAPYILVVDDEAVVRDFLARCLVTDGYVVKQAGSAAEALELMALEPASVVLCDIRMPGQDGLWLVERIHRLWPQTPIVMATALDDVETVKKSRDLGAADYIAKPIKPEQVREVVRRVTAAQVLNNAVGSRLQNEEADPAEDRIDAEYSLETAVRCPACGERITTLKAVRMIRAQVNFTSTLPRRGRVTACPHCLAIVPAELTNF